MDPRDIDNLVPVELLVKSRLMKGRISCPIASRISDLLNGEYVRRGRAKSEFLEFVPAADVPEIGIQPETFKEHIRKTAIDLLALSADGVRKGVARDGGPQVYPYKRKKAVSVRLEVSLSGYGCSLSGSMHCGKGQTSADVLNDDRQFLVLTNVTLAYEVGMRGTRPFVAVNKAQIISCREQNVASVPELVHTR
jgi:hypothetical protein